MPQVDILLDEAEHPKLATQRGLSGVLIATTGQIAITVVSIVTAILLPRTLQPYDYGVYSAVFAILIFVQQTMSFGIPSVGYRYVGPSWFANERDKAIKAAGALWTAVLILSSLGAAAVFTWIFTTSRLGIGLTLSAAVAFVFFVKNGTALMNTMLIAVGQVRAQVGLELLSKIGQLAMVLSMYLLFNLNAVFIGLAVFSTGVFFLVWARLFKTIPVKFDPFFFDTIKPFRRYLLMNYVGGVSVAVQTSLSIFIVAVVVSIESAALIAVAMQAVNVLRSLVGSAIRVLLPILAGFDLKGQDSRFFYWGGLILRMSVFIVVITSLGWAFIGQATIETLLTDTYRDCYQMIMLGLLYLMFFVVGSTHTRLINIKGFAGTAFVSNLIHLAGTTIGFIWIIISAPVSSPIHALLWVNIMAASVFACWSIYSFWRVTKVNLDIARALGLCLPLPCIWLWSPLDLSHLGQLLVTSCICAVYCLYAIIFIRPQELLQIVKGLKAG